MAQIHRKQYLTTLEAAISDVLEELLGGHLECDDHEDHEEPNNSPIPEDHWGFFDE